MSIKTRIAKMEQTSKGNEANLHVIIQQPGETREEAEARCEAEHARHPGARPLLVTFVSPGGEDVKP